MIMLQNVPASCCNFTGSDVLIRISAKFDVDLCVTFLNFQYNPKSNDLWMQITTWCRQVLMHYHIHKELQHDLVKRSDKGQHRTRPRFWCGEYLCKITKGYWQFLRSYCIHKAAWPWASLKVRKGHTKFNVKLIWDFDVENIPIKLQPRQRQYPSSL